MKSIKHIAIGAFVTLVVFCAIFYSSCSKDGCKGVTCINTGTCSGGQCTCPTGIGGNNCQTVYRQMYANTYKGAAVYSSADTTFSHSDSSSSLIFAVGTDTTYTLMQLTFMSDGAKVFATPITLANNSTNGSTFTITSVTIDSNTYSGSGTVSANSASLTLTKSHPNKQAVTITLNNFIKQ